MGLYFYCNRAKIALKNKIEPKTEPILKKTEPISVIQNRINKLLKYTISSLTGLKTIALFYVQ